MLQNYTSCLFAGKRSSGNEKVSFIPLDTGDIVGMQDNMDNKRQCHISILFY